MSDVNCKFHSIQRNLLTDVAHPELILPNVRALRATSGPSWIPNQHKVVGGLLVSLGPSTVARAGSLVEDRPLFRKTLRYGVEGIGCGMSLPGSVAG